MDEPSRHGRDKGFTLIEATIAISLLALVIIFMSGNLITSAWGTQQAQARLVAAEIASKTLQQATKLGYESVSEGLECATADCTSLAYPDPNGQLNRASDGCWYFTSPANQLLVPTQYNPTSGTTDIPIVPNTTTTSGPYQSPTVNGVTYTVTTYPMFNETEFSAATPPVTCTDLANGTAADVPVTVVVEVTWAQNAKSPQSVSMQTMLYDAPQPVDSAGNCPTPAAQAGAHDEQLMANQETNGSLATTAAPGDTVSVMFLDEKPTPYNPSFCLTDSSGNTQVESAAQLGVTVTTYGTQSQPYYSGTITPVHPAWHSGSGPNAANPPAGGTYCTKSTCNLEVVFSFVVPSIDSNGYTVSSITVADWDHEGDLDFATWKIT